MKKVIDTKKGYGRSYGYPRLEEDLKYRILKIISCGEPFSNWVCGDFLEQEVDEEGRSLGKCYFCDKCHKKADEIINIFKLDKLVGKDFI